MATHYGIMVTRKLYHTLANNYIEQTEQSFQLMLYTTYLFNLYYPYIRDPCTVSAG